MNKVNDFDNLIGGIILWEEILKILTLKQKRDSRFMKVFNEELKKHGNVKKARKDAMKRMGSK